MTIATFLITNGGPHPADKWAEITAQAITDLIQVKEDSVSDEAVTARRVKMEIKPKLFEVFMEHHDGVQRTERSSLHKIKRHKDACEHLVKAIELHPGAIGALEAVNKILQATPYAEHFAQEGVQLILQAIIGQHTADVQHIERRWHADRLAPKEAQ